MQELINVTVNDNQQQVVSARELHKVLEVKTRFSQWVQQNFKMFIQGVDFTSVVTTTVVNNGAVRELQDYAVTIRMAEHLAMMSKTNKGHEVREYFIQLEEKWNDPQEIVKRGYEILQNENTQLKLENSRLVTENQIMAPKAKYFDDCVDKENSASIRDTAKLLKIKERNFVKYLLDNNFLYRDKKGTLKPYAHYNNDLFIVKEFRTKAYTGVQTRVTSKGHTTFNLLLGNK